MSKQNFGAFLINSIFKIYTGPDIIVSELKEGNIPLVSNKATNNSIIKYVPMLEGRTLFNHKKTLSLAAIGTFYATSQCNDFYIGERVKALEFLDGEHSENVRLYFSSVINKLGSMFDGYNSEPFKKLPTLKIILPIKQTSIKKALLDISDLDYTYMDSYIQQIKVACINEQEESFNKHILDCLTVSGYESIELTPSEKAVYQKYQNSQIKYATFSLGKGENRLFDISSPKKRFNANSVKFGGLYPYVARTSTNNGIKGYITEDTRFLNEGNTISFGQDTATIFYQDKPYFTGDKIKILTYRDRELSPKLACYLITVMNKAFQTFTWGQSSFNETILKNIEILLPVTKEHLIDYEFIISFISIQEKLAISDLKSQYATNIFKMRNM